jgi:hypothetical protein
MRGNGKHKHDVLPAVPDQTDALRPQIEKVAEARLPTEIGEFRVIGFHSLLTDQEYVVLTKGDLKVGRPCLVRIHSQCLTGDVFRSTKWDCGRQLRRAMGMIEEDGLGVIIYQPEEGRGIVVEYLPRETSRVGTGKLATLDALLQDFRNQFSRG